MINPPNESSKIPYYDKLPSRGGTLKFMSADVFNEKFGCHYQETLSIPEQARQDLRNFTPPSTGFQNKDAIIAGCKKRLSPSEPPIIGIVNISETVGHGVITLRDIRAGEVIGIYAGEVVKIDSSTLRGDDYLYHYPNTAWCVSPRYAGGLVRFMPHLPIDHEKTRKAMIENFTDPVRVANLLAERMPNVSRNFIDSSLKHTMKGTSLDPMIASIVDEAIKLDREQNTEWSEYAFMDLIDRERVATANVDPCIVMMNEFPFIAMVAKHAISKHEVVGFSYGKKYWSDSKRHPVLLTRQGELMDKSRYHRDHASFELALPSGRVMLNLTHREVVEDVNSDKPVVLYGKIKDDYFSLYKLRHKAAEVSLVTNRYHRVDNNVVANTLADHIKNEETQYTVHTYYRNPGAKGEQLDDHCVDAVIQAETPKAYNKLLVTLAPMAKWIKKIPETNEVVVQDTNGRENEQMLECARKIK